MSTKEESWQDQMLRRHEAIVIETQVGLKDFIERYNQDRRACTERYMMEHEEAIQWRVAMDKKIDDINKFLIELKPNYQRLLTFVGLCVVGAFGLIFKTIWNHIQR